MIYAGAVTTITEHSICRGSGGGIAPGEMAIFTEKLKGEQHWRPENFKCSVCDECLVDNIYFVKDEKIYCGRHYHEQIKPRCKGCDEVCCYVNNE